MTEHPAAEHPATVTPQCHRERLLLIRWRDASLNEDLSRMADLTNETTAYLDSLARPVEEEQGHFIGDDCTEDDIGHFAALEERK